MLSDEVLRGSKVRLRGREMVLVKGAPEAILGIAIGKVKDGHEAIEPSVS
jgi:hypothetical protein